MLLNATKIGTEVELAAKEINKIFTDLGFIKRVGKDVLSLNKLAVQKKSDSGQYVLWSDKILEDESFIKAVLDFKNPVSVKKETSKKISATVIGKKLGLTGKKVNQVLLQAGYISKSGKGYISEHKLATTKLFGDENIPFVSWDEAILDDKIFVTELTDFKETVKEYKEEISEKKPFKFDRTIFKAEFRTADGHYVRSKAEVIIDNWLFMNGMVHAYEKRLPIEAELYSDFFIPSSNGNVYIEYWGYEDDPKYLDRKQKKIALYKDNGFNMIGLNDEDVKDIDDVLPLKLLKFGIQVR
jgi:hypothetical protein